MGMRGDWGPVQKEVPASRRWVYRCRARALGLSRMWHICAISVAVCVRLQGYACIPLGVFACDLCHRYALTIYDCMMHKSGGLYDRCSFYVTGSKLLKE